MRLELWPNFSLSDAGGTNDGCPSVTPYLLEGQGPYPVVIVCPGGGYAMRAPHESEPIARWLNSIGVSAVVLDYRVAPYQHPDPMLDVQRAIRLTRYHAADWKIDASRVGVLGFSAGGHLAAVAGTHFDYGRLDSADPIEKLSARPDLMVLCYAFISMQQAVLKNLVGESPDPALIRYLSVEQNVSHETPPAFIWHTADDEVVPVRHALCFAGALDACSVPFERHIFQKGVHGVALGEGYREVQAWTSLCEAWLKARRFIRTEGPFSGYSTVGQILNHPEATRTLERFIPGIARDESLSWMRPFSLLHLADIPESPVTPALVHSIAEELARIDD